MTPTPTTYGEWRMVDGQLIDERSAPAPADVAEQAPATEQDPAPAVPDSTPATFSRRR